MIDPKSEVMGRGAKAEDSIITPTATGLSARDYLASQFMAAIVAAEHSQLDRELRHLTGGAYADDMAETAYKLADALIRASTTSPQEKETT